jgi:hypothetical protein
MELLRDPAFGVASPILIEGFAPAKREVPLELFFPKTSATLEWNPRLLALLPLKNKIAKKLGYSSPIILGKSNLEICSEAKCGESRILTKEKVIEFTDFIIILDLDSCESQIGCSSSTRNAF